MVDDMESTCKGVRWRNWQTLQAPWWRAYKVIEVAHTGSNPVLTTCFGERLLLIHRNLHNGESVELDLQSGGERNTPRKWRVLVPTRLTEILRPQLMVSITGSSPVLTTCFGGRLLLIHRNLHNGESVELDFQSGGVIGRRVPWWDILTGSNPVLTTDSPLVVHR